VLRPAGQPAARAFQAIHFHADLRQEAPVRYERMAYKLRWNRWNGSQTLQLVIEEASPG
jgi:hypothetical protein